jgi:hypothetical protein
MGMVYAKDKPTTSYNPIANPNKANWSNWIFLNYIFDVSNVVIN